LAKDSGDVDADAIISGDLIAKSHDELGGGGIERVCVTACPRRQDGTASTEPFRHAPRCGHPERIGAIGASRRAIRPFTVRGEPSWGGWVRDAAVRKGRSPFGPVGAVDRLDVGDRALGHLEAEAAIHGGRPGVRGLIDVEGCHLQARRCRGRERPYHEM